MKKIIFFGLILISTLVLSSCAEKLQTETKQPKRERDCYTDPTTNMLICGNQEGDKELTEPKTISKSKIEPEPISNNDCKPTERETRIYNYFEDALYDEPDVAEEIIEARVARELGISKEELSEIWLKAFGYEMGYECK